MTRRGLRPRKPGVGGRASAFPAAPPSWLLGHAPWSSPAATHRCSGDLPLAAAPCPLPGAQSTARGPVPSSPSQPCALGHPPPPTSGFSYCPRSDTLPPLRCCPVIYLPVFRLWGHSRWLHPHHLRLSGVRQASNWGSPLRGLSALPSAACPWLMERNKLVMLTSLNSIFFGFLDSVSRVSVPRLWTSATPDVSRPHCLDDLVPPLGLCSHHQF